MILMCSLTSSKGTYVTCVKLMHHKMNTIYQLEAFLSIGFNGVYFEDRFLGVRSSVGCSWLTSSVMTLKPRASSSETTRGGGESPPSMDECLSLMVLVTSTKLLADKTDNEVGGRRVPTTTWLLLLSSAEDREEMEPLELANERWGGPIWPVGIQ